jgi:serine/threonine protein kinase
MVKRACFVSVTASQAVLHVDSRELKLLEVIGQGSYGTVHLASWRGSLVAAKAIPLTPRDVKSIQIQREVDILK